MERDHRHHHRHGSHHHHGCGGATVGLVVIAWGTLLLLRGLGLVSPELRALDFWPLILVGFGLSAAFGGRRLGSRLLGLVAAAFGVALLGEKLGWVTAGVAQLWPVLIVVAGIALVWNGLTRRRRPAIMSAGEEVSADEIRRTVTMGELSLAVDSQQFKGGSVGATMGEIRLDLRRAAIPGDEVVLDLKLLMSSVELYVPSSWRVVNDLSPMMAEVEDRTEPRPDGAGVQKRLVLRGTATMAAVTVRN